MNGRATIGICVALTAALAGCARAALDPDAAAWNVSPSSPFEMADARVSDGGRDASIDAQARDAALEDAAPRDAGRVMEAGTAPDAHVADAQAAAPDAAMTCDVAPCVGHCPLSNVCCSLIGTCGCDFAGLCLLPPLGTN